MIKSDKRLLEEGQILSYTAIQMPLPWIIESNQQVFNEAGLDLVYLGRGIVDYKRPDFIRKILNNEIKITVNDTNLRHLVTLDYDISPITPEPVEDGKEFCRKLVEKMTPIPDITFEYGRKKKKTIQNTEFREYDVSSTTHLKDFRDNYVYAHNYDITETEDHLEDITYRSVEIYRNPNPKDPKIFKQTVNKITEIAIDDDSKDEFGRFRVRSKEAFIDEIKNNVEFVAQKLDIEPLEPVIKRIPNAQKYYPFLF